MVQALKTEKQPAEARSAEEMSLRVETAGYGWHVVGVRVFPGDEEGAPGKGRSVRLTVPGYGRAPLRMAFLGRARPSDPGQ